MMINDNMLLNTSIMDYQSGYSDLSLRNFKINLLDNYKTTCLRHRKTAILRSKMKLLSHLNYHADQKGGKS